MWRSCGDRNRVTWHSKQILFNPTDDNQAPFIFHSKVCNSAAKSIRNQWKKIRCEKKDKILPEEIVQVKMDNKYVYFYCYTQNMTRDGEEISCQNRIYKVRKGRNITINQHTVHFQRMRIEFLANLDPELLEVINDKTYNDEDRSVILKDLENIIEQEHRVVTQITISYLRYPW